MPIGLKRGVSGWVLSLLLIGCAADAGRSSDSGELADTSDTFGTVSWTSDPGAVLARKGRHLMRNGARYRSVGLNAPGIAGCETGRPYSDAQVDQLFAALPPNSLTRAWAFETQGMSGIDRMVHWAELHSQLLILTLADGRSYCGETDGSQGGDGSGKVSSWYSGGYKTHYIPWLERVVKRFKDSKAIGMWELLNEPSDTDDNTMRAFFDDAASHIKVIDPRHLISSGSQAEYVSGTSDFAYVHGGPNIDVASLHEYDYDFEDSHEVVSSHLAPALSAMRSLDKPLIVGEVGVEAGDDSGCTSRSTRRDVFRQKFDAYLGQDGVDAVLVWDYSPAKHSDCENEIDLQDPTMDLLRTYL